MSLLAALVGLGGTMYVAGASLLGISFIAVAAGFVSQHSTGRARILFRTSLIYLPLLWGLLVAEHAF